MNKKKKPLKKIWIKTTNDRFFLGKIQSRLETMASNHGYKLLNWPLNDTIFEFIDVNQFKQACNEVLKNLRIVLFTNPLTVTDNDEKQKFIAKYHDDPLSGGHLSRNKIYARLREMYYRKGMSKDIVKYVKNCEKCLLNKIRSATREPMQPTPTPQRPFDCVIVDTIGPLQNPNDGNKYAVTLICDLNKYLIAVPVADKSAKSVARAIFGKFILIYGPMKQIRSDMGSEYKNELFPELCRLPKIEHRTSTAYHHEVTFLNGMNICDTLYFFTIH